jgi:hypothetical protein
MEQEAIEPSARELAWRQYNLLIDLYKHYTELIVQINIFFYGITGAILTFLFANPNEKSLKYSLLLPIGLSLLLVGICIYGARLWVPFQNGIYRLCRDLELKIWPDVRIFSVALWASGLLFLCTGIGMIVLMILR